MKPYYDDGSVTLYHGDCLAILPTLGQVDHVITDPPYEAEAHTLQRRVKRADGSGNTVAVLEPLDFSPMTQDSRQEAAAAFARASRRWVLVFCQIEGSFLWRASCEAQGLVYKRTCVWVKPDGMPQLTGDRPGMGYEALITFHVKGRSRWNGGGRHGVYTVPKGADGASGKNPHPTQKPEVLMNALISDFTDAGETILDPFAGSGTTGVAAKRLGRKAILIEREEKYCEVAAKRLAQGALDLWGQSA